MGILKNTGKKVGNLCSVGFHMFNLVCNVFLFVLDRVMENEWFLCGLDSAESDFS